MMREWKKHKKILFFFMALIYIRIMIPIINHYLVQINKCFYIKYKNIEINSLFKCILELFRTPIIGMSFVLISVIFISMVNNILSTIKSFKIEYEGIKYKNKDGTFGTADWATIDEAKNYLSIGKEDGMILGKTEQGEAICLPEHTWFNKNIATFGSSGSRKTRAFVITNILAQSSLGKSIICTDPKAEIYKKCCKYLEKKGYKVKLLNLVTPEYSECWNPICEVENETDAQVFAEVVIANTKIDRSKGGDEFWTRTEQNLLKALILHIVQEVEDENKKNMGYLYSILSSGNLKRIDDIFKNSKGAAKMSYNIYAQATDAVKQSIVTGLATRLQIFQTDEINTMTSRRDIDLENAGNEKVAYFCVSSDMDSTFDFLVRLIFFIFIYKTNKKS